MKVLCLSLLAFLPPLSAISQTVELTPAETAQPNAIPDTEGLIGADNPDRLVDEMQRLGYRAQLTTDEYGDPKILSAAAGSNFAVYFYGCEDGQSCTSIQFSSGFDTDDGRDLSVANEWNENNRYGKAYLDSERDPFLEMDMSMTGGISADLFAENLRIWDIVLAEYKEHIGW
ncbi:YbjN domain-containing protein [Albirhodobacter sp. R86504]|uniref:YbjN domain-containing protein n=1 Tax=Albirhodobacter sp. R86504 TaxID=3093848 RepID=UPI00366A6119